MADDPGTHPDEGTIHAWLDDALDASSAASLETHVATCAECAERVAEARGLIAGASRVVGALDDVPAGVMPAWGQPRPAVTSAVPTAPAVAERVSQEGSLWRLLRVTPARAAIAASLIVAVGVTLSRDRGGLDAPTVKTLPVAVREESAVPQDGLLDSAVARNLAEAQPPRSMQAAPGPDMPTPPAAAPPPMAESDASAGTRVAAGRAAAALERETASVAADRARAGAPGGPGSLAPGASPDAMAATAAASAPGVGGAATGQAQARVAVAGASPTRLDADAAGCLVIESARRNSAWGPAPFPLVIATGAPGAMEQGRPVLVHPTGSALGAQAIVRQEGDSLKLDLRRIGYYGTIALGPEIGPSRGRMGIARSAAATSQLESVVVVGMATEDRQSTTSAAATPSAPAAPVQPRSAQRIPAAKSATSQSAADAAGVSANSAPGASSERARALAAASPIAVTARPAACPAPR